jgi:gamma-glutamyl hercynylcysteine S-oxide synthase
MRYSKIPPVEKSWLRDALRDADSHTLAMLGAVDAGPVSLQPPRPDCDPLLWSLGHIVWFQEKFGLRSGASSQIAGADTLFDPAITRRRARWESDLPDGAKLLAWKSDIRDRLIDSLAGDGLASVEESYFVRLAIQIEDMQGEALVAARQALGLPGPDLGSYGEVPAGDAATGDVSIPGGIHMLGASSRDPFYMDNEKWGHGYEVKPFAIARVSVTNAEYRDFVEDEGYQRQELWSRVGWGWCRHAAARHPRFWEKLDGIWGARIFDRVEPLVEDAPIVHVTWYEAEAWCRWAHRRLPWEGEWEVAAQRVPSPDHKTLHGIMRRYPRGELPPTAEQANMEGRLGGTVPVLAFPGGDSGYGCRQMAGNVWEWTASAFDAYTGFVADAWEDYSVPYFDGRHGVLRGGSWATRSRAAWNSFRGFQPLDRANAIAGFRTCAI